MLLRPGDPAFRKFRATHEIYVPAGASPLSRVPSPGPTRAAGDSRPYDSTEALVSLVGADVHIGPCPYMASSLAQLKAYFTALCQPLRRAARVASSIAGEKVRSMAQFCTTSSLLFQYPTASPAR